MKTEDMRAAGEHIRNGVIDDLLAGRLMRCVDHVGPELARDENGISTHAARTQAERLSEWLALSASERAEWNDADSWAIEGAPGFVYSDADSSEGSPALAEFVWIATDSDGAVTGAASATLARNAAPTDGLDLSTLMATLRFAGANRIVEIDQAIPVNLLIVNGFETSTVADPTVAARMIARIIEDVRIETRGPDPLVVVDDVYMGEFLHARTEPDAPIWPTDDDMPAAYAELLVVQPAPRQDPQSQGWRGDGMFREFSCYGETDALDDPGSSGFNLIGGGGTMPPIDDGEEPSEGDDARDPAVLFYLQELDSGSDLEVRITPDAARLLAERLIEWAEDAEMADRTVDEAIEEIRASWYAKGGMAAGRPKPS